MRESLKNFGCGSSEPEADSEVKISPLDVLGRIKGPRRPNPLRILREMAAEGDFAPDKVVTKLGEHAKAAVPALTKHLIKGGPYAEEAKQILMLLGHEAAEAERPILTALLERNSLRQEAEAVRIERAAGLLPVVSARSDTLIALIEKILSADVSRTIRSVRDPEVIAESRYESLLKNTIVAFGAAIESSAPAILDKLIQVFPKDPFDRFYRLNEIGVPIVREGFKRKVYLMQALQSCRMMSPVCALQLLPEIADLSPEARFHVECEAVFLHLPKSFPETTTEQQRQSIVQNLIAATAKGKHPMIEQYLYRLGKEALPFLEEIAGGDGGDAHTARRIASDIRTRHR